MGKKPESTFINMVSRLFAVVAVAGAALGFVYMQTFDVIQAAKKKKLETAIGNVVPAFDTLITYKVMPATGKDSITFYEAYANKELVGTAIATYTEKGFSGVFKIMVGFSPDGTIINTAVLEHKETPGLGDKMDKKKAKWSIQFNDKNPKTYILKVTKDGGNVDAITAATISSRAFCDATQRAYDALEAKGGKNE
ncbi:MAG: RnfABCDGE type electron transport complex subunit G [Bacteroidales bacterium]|nr:RnfABCDGE type electron transport complex subunit G [Bacteroidales bacterium]